MSFVSKMWAVLGLPNMMYIMSDEIAMAAG